MRSLTFGMLVIFGLCTAANASVVLSENFNGLTPMLSATSVGAFHTISGTNVDIVGPGLFGYLCAAPESGNCIDMNGTGGNPQGQLQSNMLFSSGTYLLSFDLIGSRRGSTDSVTVTFGGYSHMFTLPSSDTTGGIVTNQSVTLTSPGYLLFASDVPGDVGLLLDNVVVSTSVVPEPSSFVPLASALLVGLGLIVRRRLPR
jgi:hypothetical protein